MTRSYTPKAGDIVTVDGARGKWMILAPAPLDTGVPCECKLPRWQRMKWRGNAPYESHGPTCPARRKTGHYWLQCADTGALYRPSGTDEAVHKSRLTLISAHSLPTRRELLAAELF